ncbi:MAG TPA: oxidoreductase [Rhodospirillaceae bacterium]|nr:oxidoreductase [Rhodospirillaceae bacterium]MBB58372.1 oxidoreductase [Rhodospirillaceae bacterium]HAJ19296.1 oxidoreductase [Rhodospirillaceae bacterium]|tara:strand:+ start:3819 stop:4322 length:504 start_codon:yes stop_codon:yes gene_type:complete
MALLKNGTQVSDQWLVAGDDTPVQADIPTIVSYKRFLAERDTLVRSRAELGVKLAPGDDVAAIASDLPRLQVVALDFPKFTDGRAYSTARLLRQRYGFQGEVRATGDVLRDQYLFMKRAGFDAFQVKDGAETQAWIAAMGELSHYYQPAADGTPAVWAQRHAIAAAE